MSHDNTAGHTSASEKEHLSDMTVWEPCLDLTDFHFSFMVNEAV
jgi:hypothetical protein